MKDNINSKEIHPLIQAVFTLLAAHRSAFRQERTYQRSVGLLFGELFNFARHTVTQGLLTLGLTDDDWSAWYRLFSRKRFEEERLADCLLEQTVPHVPEREPYVVAIDGTSIHRSSLKMPGTSWLRDSRFSAFRPGIHRAQRFLHGAWLPPCKKGSAARFLCASCPPTRRKPTQPKRPTAGNGKPGWCF